MARKTKESWLEEGINVLSKSGAGQLTIDVLSRRLKVTKGSFYHHFKNRRTFVEELLKFWEHELTLEIIELTEEERSPEEKIKRLTDLAVDLKNASLEVNIRVWALRDPLVKRYQQRVDRLRLAYVQDLCLAAITDDKEKAQVISRILCTIYIGAQQILPSIQGKALHKMFEEMQRLYGIS